MIRKSTALKIINALIVLELFLLLLIVGFMLGRYWLLTSFDRAGLAKISTNVEVQREAFSNGQAPEKDLIEVYKELYEQNNDFVGWITIENTTINGPVMHTPNNEEYYLRRNFEKGYSISGSYFMNKDAQPMGLGTNLIIYGHNMKNHSMFADVESYLDNDFFNSHKNVRYDTLDGIGEYTVVAVFHMSVAEENPDMYCYRFGAINTAEDEAKLQDYIINTAKVFDPDNLPQIDDSTILLSTCDNVTDDGRITLLLRRVN